MPFEIPSEGLGQFTISALRDMQAKAKAEYEQIKGTVTPDTVTDEDLDRLRDLQQFSMTTVPAEVAGRERRHAEFAALDEPAEEEASEEAAEGDAEETAEEGEPEPVTASTKVTVRQLAGNTKTTSTAVATLERRGYGTLVAAAGVPDFEAGHEFADMVEVARAFENRSAGHSSHSGGAQNAVVHYPVATLRREYPEEFSVDGDQGDYAKLLSVMDESRLPGGNLLNAAELRRKEVEQETGRDALVAAAGWCAPSEVDYSICLQITTDGLLDAPEVQARRGGIRHNTGLDFGTIFAGPISGTTGFFNMTEAQVAAGTTKTCLEIPCPSFVDDRLGITGVCLTGNILSIRGYPEFTAAFVKGALAASAHQVNAQQIAAIIADSTAVNLTAANPWSTDSSVVSQVLSAAEMAAVDIKYRLRMQRSATLEAVFPFWILAQMRADWIRRNGGNYAEMLSLADSAITSAFGARGIRPQFVYDWQDAFATNGAVTGMPGLATPISAFPSSLQFIVYPAGTWVRAVSDVITLNSVYDSTKLATNQVTHLFTETGWKMIRMCPVSRVYTVPICPSGRTGNQQTIVCP
jgi:hypothetical protein